MSTTTTLRDRPSSSRPFSWSYSQLNSYETCPRRYQAYNVTKEVVEPENEVLREGKNIHAAFEARINMGTKLPLGMGMHEPLMAKLTKVPGQVYGERKLAMNADFAPTTWFSPATWFRQIIDYTNVRDDGVAVVVDFKTGKPKEDPTQLELSALSIMAHDESVTTVRTALIFVGYDNYTDASTYSRSDITHLWDGILPRVNELKRARDRDEFPPKPGGLCRRYCGVKSCPFWGT